MSRQCLAGVDTCGGVDTVSEETQPKSDTGGGIDGVIRSWSVRQRWKTVAKHEL